MPPRPCLLGKAGAVWRCGDRGGLLLLAELGIGTAQAPQLVVLLVLGCALIAIIAVVPIIASKAIDARLATSPILHRLAIERPDLLNKMLLLEADIGHSAAGHVIREYSALAQPHYDTGIVPVPAKASAGQYALALGTIPVLDAHTATPVPVIDPMLHLSGKGGLCKREAIALLGTVQAELGEGWRAASELIYYYTSWCEGKMSLEPIAWTQLGKAFSELGLKKKRRHVGDGVRRVEYYIPPIGRGPWAEKVKRLKKKKQSATSRRARSHERIAA